MAEQRLRIDLQEAPIDVGSAFQFMQTPEAGGHCLFVGTTRNTSDGRRVVQLSYEAYPEMAIRKMTHLAEQAMEKWHLHRCLAIHRIGEVPAADASIVIGVCSSHRVESFHACRWMIDQIKIQVPIWKREIFADGGGEWVKGVLPEAK